MPDHAQQHRRTRIPGAVDPKAVVSPGTITYYGVDGLWWGFAVDQLPVVADGTAMSSVTDLSGAGYNATQSDGTKQPLYRTNQINSLPALQFDGSNDHLQLPNRFSTLTAAEVFIIVKVNNDPGSATATSGLWSFGASGNLTHYPWTDGNIYDDFGSNARKTVGNPTPTLAAWRLYQVATAAGAWTAWLDGTQIFTTGTNTVAWKTANLAVGLSDSGVGSTSVMPGYIAEILLYDHVLTSGDRTTLKAALASKYGLTIA